MRKNLLFILACSFLITVAILALYFLGYVRFNYPDPNRFPVRGIDISHHQGTIDWITLKEEKINFIYMKATEGGDFKDPSFKANWKEASRLGIVRGAYHFFTFCKPGKAQAANFIQTVPIEPNTLPPVIDFEFTGNCKSRPSKDNLLREIHNFVEAVQKRYGRKPLIYVTYKAYETYLIGEIDQHQIWIRDIFKYPRFRDGRSWTFWQYTNRGRLMGINGPVDLNVFNGTMQEFTNLVQANGN